MNRLTVSAFALPSLPVKDTLIIKKLTDLTTNIYFSILDVSGKIIMQNSLVEFCEDIVKISVDSLKNGMYLLKISSDESYIMSSFIKE